MCERSLCFSSHEHMKHSSRATQNDLCQDPHQDLGVPNITSRMWYTCHQHELWEGFLYTIALNLLVGKSTYWEYCLHLRRHDHLLKETTAHLQPLQRALQNVSNQFSS
jgi:hypothetical protein